MSAATTAPVELRDSRARGVARVGSAVAGGDRCTARSRSDGAAHRARRRARSSGRVRALFQLQRGRVRGCRPALAPTASTEPRRPLPVAGGGRARGRGVAGDVPGRSVFSIGVLFDPVAALLAWYLLLSYPGVRLTRGATAVFALAVWTIVVGFVPWFFLSPTINGGDIPGALHGGVPAERADDRRPPRRRGSLRDGRGGLPRRVRDRDGRAAGQPPGAWRRARGAGSSLLSMRSAVCGSRCSGSSARSATSPSPSSA